MMPPAGRNLKAQWQGLWPAAWGFDKLSLSGWKGRGIEGRRICMEWNRQITSLPAGGIFG
jgi:hypothetical protein